MFLDGMEEKTICWDDLVIIELKNVSNSDLVASHVMKPVNEVIFGCKSLEEDSVCFPVLTPSFHVCEEFS